MVAYRKLSQHTGAEIIGVDLSKTVTANDAAEIYQIFLDHCLVVFRDQALSQEDLVRITGHFGKCARYDRPVELQSETQRKTLQQVMLITNIRQDGKPIGALPDGEMWFHHDMIHSELPHKATLLYSVEVPTWGGNITFLKPLRRIRFARPRTQDAAAGSTCAKCVQLWKQVQRRSRGADNTKTSRSSRVVSPRGDWTHGHLH